ncbi:hypothetical protein [Mycobacterium sp. 1245111.1]|uniref:hypothetical protein n=1 Tax=Mycobacterium sp. 1245111.1 TaxID=1834073 RepID=UPI000A816C47|nr:hypothetical protein [Mycobacterium sp. 1245111.1]
MNETTKRSPAAVHGHDLVGRDVDVTVTMKCEVYQEEPQGCFCATLIREETRFWDDDPDPDIVETIVCETQLHCSVPEVFTAVDEWLIQGHHLTALPESWKSGDTGPGTGVVLLLFAQLLPSHQPESATA